MSASPPRPPAAAGMLLADEQQVDERRLVVGLERRPPRQARCPQLAGLHAGGARRAH